MKQKFMQFSLLAIGLLMGCFSVVAQSPTYTAVQVSDVGTSNSIGTSNSSRNIGVDREGNIYVIFWGSSGVRVAKSTNRGQSFLASVPVDNNTTTGEADIEIADNGNIYVTWIRSTVAYFSKSTDGGATFSTPTTLGSGYSGSYGIRIESYGDNIYILPKVAAVMYRNTTQGDGSFTAVNTGVANRTFSDIFADQYSGDLYIVGDNPIISIHKSTDNGSTFGSISLNPSISRYYSSYVASITYAGKYAFAGGGSAIGDVKIGYKINLTDGTSTAITLGDNKVASGRSLLVDDFGNLVDGYSITTTSVGFRISNNQGSAWGSEIEVATNATGQNLFRNKKDVLAAYVSGGQVYLSTYIDILPIPCEPTISPSTAQTVASGASISFSGSSIASSPSYTWSSIPNGFSSSDRNPTFIAPTVASSTDYILRLNTTEGNCSADAIVKVTVVPPCTPPTANISYTGTPFCSNALPVSVALTGTNTYTGGFYSSTAGLSIDAVTGEITPSTSSAGVYTVTYTIAAAGGCDPVTATTSVSINPLPTAYSVTGGGPYCAGGSGSEVGLASSQTGVNYQLKKDGSNVGSVVAGTGSALPFGNQTGAGAYTVEATTATGGCVASMSGNVAVSVVTLPVTFTVTGGGSYCSGGTGVVVGLSGSESGVSYQLKNGGANVGSAVPGTGSALSFGLQIASGTYTVEASKAGASPARIGVGAGAPPTATTCTQAMTGSVAVTVISLPTAYNVTGGGPYCAGGSGSEVGLASSQTGVNYQLKKDGNNVGSAVAGTDSALPFGNQTGAGTYTVESTTTAGGCAATMTGSVTVTVISLPTAYSVTGGGSYCAGGTGVAVGLSNSQTGVNYQLKKDGNNVGSLVAGTGSALPFGNQTGAGTYTVEATTTTGGCVLTMTGLVTVSIDVLPTAFTVTGGGSYCQGGTGVLVGLSSSSTGINYQLKLGGVVVGSSLPGTGSALSFGLQTSLGTYMVVATNAATNCTLGMTGTAQVASYPLPLATVSGTTTACKGGASSTLTFTGSNGTSPYTFSYQLNGGTVQTVTTTGGSSTATLIQSSSAEGVYNYTLVSVSDANCSQSQSGSAVVRVQTKPVITLTTLQQTLNEGNSQVLCDIDANPVNGLQFTVTGLCVVGNPVWRVQVGAGAWSAWSPNAPVSQPSNNQPHRYQAACDASCPVTYTNPIELTINYRSTVPQNVTMLVDGVTLSVGETKEVCSLVNIPLVFIANCGSNEVTLYSVDGGEYSAGAPVGLVDNQYHNYRVRCRKSDGTPSCVESESGVMRLKLVTIPSAPTVSLSSTSSCDATASFSGQSTCGSLRTVWYNATTNVALPNLPSTVPNQTTSYYARCQTETGCVSEKSNMVTFTLTPTQVAPIVTVSQEIVCTGTTVTISANCPAGSTTRWSTGVTTPSFEVAFSSVTKQTYWAKCFFEGGCQSAESARKDVYWNAFVVTLINIGESKSAVKPANDKSLWTSQFITRDGGPELDQSTQVNPTLYYVENANKLAPRYWTINVDVCGLGTDGSLTFDMLATPEMGVIRSFNTHENNAPYFMYANREGWTELYAQNHPAYGFYQDNGAGGNFYDTGLPKGLYKLGIRYWDMKGWGSIYPSTRKPQGNVLAYQEYWFRIQSKDGIGVGAAKVSSLPFTVEGGQHSTLEFATVVPNPVTRILRLQVQSSKGQSVQTVLTDASGREILHRQFVPETNTHQEEFGVSELPTGMYFLQVKSALIQSTLKIIKL